MKKKDSFLSINIATDVNIELQAAADLLKLKKNTLARLAIEATVESIKEKGYIVLPLKITDDGIPDAKKKSAETLGGGGIASTASSNLNHPLAPMESCG